VGSVFSSQVQVAWVVATVLSGWGGRSNACLLFLQHFHSTISGWQGRGRGWWVSGQIPRPSASS